MASNRLIGRPIRRGTDGALALGEPLEVCIQGTRVCSVLPASARTEGEAMGGPDTILAPALADSHVHLLAAAAARTTLDLSPEHPTDLEGLFDRLRSYVIERPSGAWLTAHGYDESKLAEGRHPTMAEFDRNLPGRRVRLRHATLHGSLIRDPGSCHRTSGQDGGPWSEGLVMGRESELAALCGSARPGDFETALAAVGRDLCRGGIAVVDDVTATNDAARVAQIAQAVEEGQIPQRVRVWLVDASEEAAARRAAGGRVEIAGVKLLPRHAEEIRTPEFAAAIARARRAGLAIAVHAVEADEIDAALDGLGRGPARAAGGSPGPDRLEHCSLCPPYLVARLAASGVAVVTQPGFLVARGGKYRRSVEEALWSWLYPVASLRRAGVLVASGSDTPVIPVDPRLGFRGAISRRSSVGTIFGPAEAVSEWEALDLATRAAARVRGECDANRPWLRVGARADFALVSSNLLREGLGAWRAEATVIGGRAVVGTGG